MIGRLIASVWQCRPKPCARLLAIQELQVRAQLLDRCSLTTRSDMHTKSRRTINKSLSLPCNTLLRLERLSAWLCPLVSEYAQLYLVRSRRVCCSFLISLGNNFACVSELV